MVKRHNILSRCLAATALVFVYMVSVVGTSGLFLAASTSSAEARGRGRGRGGGVSFYRGRGRGGGIGFYRGRGRGYRGGGLYYAPAPIVRGGCYYNRRWGRVICPY